MEGVTVGVLEGVIEKDGVLLGVTVGVTDGVIEIEGVIDTEGVGLGVT